MGGMFLKILIECHRLFDHLLVKLGGVEQMELAIAPHSESEMGDVEPFLLTSDGDNVAIFDSLAHQGYITRQALGNISEALAGYLLFHLSDGRHIFGMSAQGLIAVGVFAHE